MASTNRQSANQLGDLPQIQLNTEKVRGLTNKSLKGQSKPQGRSTKHKPNLQSLKDEIAKQERLVEALKEQKVQRDSQMAAITAAMALVSTSSPSRDREGLTTADNGPTDNIKSDGAPMPNEMSSSSAVEELMKALSTFVAGRAADSAQREALGFVEGPCTPKRATPSTYRDPSQPTLIRDSQKVSAGDQVMDDDEFAANMQLLKEEEEALMEMAAYREAQRQQQDSHTLRRGKKNRKGKSSSIPVPPQPCANNIASLQAQERIEELEYEEDFEDEDPLSSSPPTSGNITSTVEEQTRSEVIGRLLEEFAVTNATEDRKPVGLSWLDEETS